jgi:DNA-binding transcriptional MerR regulator
MPNELSVRQLAAHLKVSPATITYYTNLGLFSVKSVSGNRKLYDKDVVTERYAKIQKARQQGYSLGLIKKMFDEGKDKDFGGGRTLWT